MLDLDTWLSNKNKSDAERCRQLFQSLTQLLPDVENVKTDELQDRITNLRKRLMVFWKHVERSHSHMVAKYSDWLNGIEVCCLTTTTGVGHR